MVIYKNLPLVSTLSKQLAFKLPHQTNNLKPDLNKHPENCKIILPQKKPHPRS